MQNAPTRGKRRRIVVEGRIDAALEKTEEAIATYSPVKEYNIIHFLISSLVWYSHRLRRKVFIPELSDSATLCI